MDDVFLTDYLLELESEFYTRICSVPLNRLQVPILINIYKEIQETFGVPTRRLLSALVTAAAKGKKLQEMFYYFKELKSHGKSIGDCIGYSIPTL
jgi:hypothetical protein